MPKYIYELVKCPFCDEKRKSTGLHKHIKTHGPELWLRYLDSKAKPKSSRTEGGFLCSECDFVGKTVQSVSSHWWRNHTQPGRNHVAIGAGAKSDSARNHTAWNKGLTKETDERVRKNGQAISRLQQKQIAEGTYIPRKMGTVARQKLSEKQALNNSGGKSKWFTVAGQRVQGTYEKQFAERLEEENILWEKIKTNNHLFRYQQDGRTRSYAPDFYLPQFDLYVEIKGFWWGDDEDKMSLIKEQHLDKKLIVLVGKSKLDEVCQNIRERLPLELMWTW